LSIKRPHRRRVFQIILSISTEPLDYRRLRFSFHIYNVKDQTRRSGGRLLKEPQNRVNLFFFLIPSSVKSQFKVKKSTQANSTKSQPIQAILKG
ncbi:hypothetical protein PQU92_12510, partial [Asticcacaulis sp. BYS171W]